MWYKIREVRLREYSRLSKHGIPLTIAHSVTPQSLTKVEEMCKLAYQLGAGTVILGEITLSGRSIDNPNILLSYEERNKARRSGNEHK